MPALLSVPNPEPGPRRRARGVAAAAASGDRRRLLVAMRDKLAEAIESSMTQAKDLPPLTRRLAEIVNELDQIDAAAPGNKVTKAANKPDEAWDSASL